MASETDITAPRATDARRVLLYVVSPSAEAKRLTFPDTPLSLTVGELKLKIRDVVPSRPPPENQRLIYQGRPLGVSTATLTSVVGQEASLLSDSFTLHLVLPPAGSGAESHLRGGTPSGTTRFDPIPTTASDSPMRQSTPQEIPNGSGSAPSLEQHLPGRGIGQEAQMGGGPQVTQNPGQVDANMQPGQPQATQRGFTHAGGHPFPTGVTTGFNPFPQLPQNPQNLPGFGNPFAMNEHMRRAFADHMQHHEGLRRNMAGHNPSANVAQDQQSSDQQEAAGASSAPANGAAEPGSAQAPGLSNNGTTIVQEGHGPNGQWRMVVNQTTIPFVQHQGPHMPLGPQLQPQGSSQTSTHAAPSHSVQAFAPQMNAPPMRFNPAAPFQNFIRHTMQQPHSSFPPLVYLLSSPTGYQAVLIPPGASPPSNATHLSPVHQPFQHGTRTSEGEAALQPPADNDQQPADQAAQPAAQQDEAVDIFRIVFPLGGHLWLLIRLLGLVYLITGGATWTRTILLSSLALVVFIAQAGWLTPIYRQIAEPLRRHLEGVVRVDHPAAQAQGQEAHPQDQQALQPEGQARVPVARDRPGPGVTPEQLAARLMREHEDRDPSIIRATMRRFERSLALFIASLVPGVGEGHVQAQQDAEIARQRAEQEREVEERRRAEEDRTNAEREASVTGEPQPATEGDQSPAAHGDENDPLLAAAT